MRLSRQCDSEERALGLTPFSQHQPASASPSLLCPHIVPGRSSSRLQATAMKAALLLCVLALANGAKQTQQADQQDFSSILVTAAPTSFAPTAMPSEAPTTESPTNEPTKEPTTGSPTLEPTEEPTAEPSAPPTPAPTACCRPKPEPCLDGQHGCDPYSTVCASLEVVQNGYGYNRTYFCECLVGFEPSDEIFKCCPPEGCPTPAPTPKPTQSPTPKPSAEPTLEPTSKPSTSPTGE